MNQCARFQLTRWGLLPYLAMVVAMGTTGCAFFDNAFAKREPPQPVAPQEGPHPMLAAARTRQITMFGEIANRNNAEYFTRAAVSVRQHTLTEEGRDFDPDIDSQGHRIIFSSTRHNTQPDLYVKNVDGVAVTQLTSDPAADLQPSLSPDDRKVAFASNRTGSWDIWIMDIDGGQPIQVTDGPGDEMHPSWSPDGTKLVYCNLPRGAGQWELWVANSEVGGRKRFIGYGLFPEWSPISDTILYQRARHRGSRWFSVWTMQLVDGEPRYPTELSASPNQAMILPTWSADGQWVAFAGTAALPPGETTAPPNEDVFDVWLIRADGSGKIRLTDGHNANGAPCFSPDGRIFFTTNRSGHENIWSLTPNVGIGPVGPYENAVTERTSEQTGQPRPVMSATVTTPGQ